jgi:hypothetical protein
MPTGKTATASGTTTGDVATISLPARRAAAQIADAKKDFTALSNEVRATLDAQYKSAGKTATPKLDELSGRALAAIALNQGGGFSRTEVSAAKAALQSREREGATGAIHGGSFAAYSQTLVTQYDAMSSDASRADEWHHAEPVRSDGVIRRSGDRQRTFQKSGHAHHQRVGELRAERVRIVGGRATDLRRDRGARP